MLQSLGLQRVRDGLASEQLREDLECCTLKVSISTQLSKRQVEGMNFRARFHESAALCVGENLVSN